MAADTLPLPITTYVVRGQRRTLLLWSVALVAVASIYTSFYPAVGGGPEIEAMMEAIPEGFAEAIGYTEIATAAGYVGSTVYGILGPVLLLVFAISTGAKLLVGGEEDGTLELELVAPVSRRAVYLQRLAALWTDVLALVVVLTAASLVLVTALDMDVSLAGLLAGGAGLLLLAGSMGTVTFAVGAMTGRRGAALGVGAGLAALGYVLNAVGASADVPALLTVSPWSWYVEPSMVANGFDVGALRLLALALAVAAAGLGRFDQRDLMV